MKLQPFATPVAVFGAAAGLFVGCTSINAQNDGSSQARTPEQAPTQGQPSAQPQTAARPNYGEALQKSIYFYECQNSGKLPPRGRAPGQNRVEWRGDSFLTDGDWLTKVRPQEYPRRVDLTGGWHDAGDTIKYNMPMSGSATALAWGAIRWRDAYKASGQLPYLLADLKFVNDYFVKCILKDKMARENGGKDDFEIVGQIGSIKTQPSFGHGDHSYWSPAEVKEFHEFHHRRVQTVSSDPKTYTFTEGGKTYNFKRWGADLAGSMAASLASASVALRADGGPENIAKADLYLEKAERLIYYAFKYRTNNSNNGRFDEAFQSVVEDGVRGSAEGYQYTNWPTNLTWGALWVHQAKNAKNAKYMGTSLSGWEKKNYLDVAQDLFANAIPASGSRMGNDPTVGYGALHPGPALYVLLAELTGGQKYVDNANEWSRYYNGLGTTDGRKTNYTSTTPALPVGAATNNDIQGTIRGALNNSFVALIWADHLRAKKQNPDIEAANRKLAQSVADFVLGNNDKNTIYMVGYEREGKTTIKEPHHAGAQGPFAGFDAISEGKPYLVRPFRHVLYGAIPGGPFKDGNYGDSISKGNFRQTEVGTDFNMGAVGVFGRLWQDHKTEAGQAPLDSKSFPPPEKRDDEFFVEARVESSSPTSIKIRAQLNNRSSWPGVMKDTLKFRYFFTPEPGTTVAARFSADRGNEDGAKITATPLKWSSTVSYIEVDFRGIRIFPSRGGGPVIKAGQVVNPNKPRWFSEVSFVLEAKGGSLDMTNDWSNGSLPTGGAAAAKTSKIVVYDGDKKLFGEEPPRS